jgi:D-citramalate synthase
MDEKSGAKVQNLLTKGSMNHLTHQLKKTPEQHFTEIAQTIALASANNIASNVYRRLERHAKLPDYVFQFLDFCPRNQLKNTIA